MQQTPRAIVHVLDSLGQGMEDVPDEKFWQMSLLGSVFPE